MIFRDWARRIAVAVAAICALAMVASPAAGQNPARPPQPPRADTTARPRADTAATPAQRADTPPAPDSVIDALLQLEGYTPVEYRGERAVFRADSGGVLRLQGSAEVTRGGERLTADSIIYWQNTNLVRASGNPAVSGGEQAITGDVLLYDLDRRLARVQGGRTSITQGATWYVKGDVTTEGAERIYATESQFTSDDREEPQYHFRAGEIKVIRDRILVARPVWLYFKNVPVAPLPFIVQDMTRGRRSGLLVPQFSINDIVRTSSGYTREISNVGFYWAANEYIGAQLSGGWRSGTYTSLLGAMQYRWRERFLDGSFNYQQYWREEGGRTTTLSTNNSWQPDERSRISLSGNYTSSASFVRNQSTDPRETQTLLSTFSADRRFGWGSVNVGGRRSQSIADERVDTELPSIGINVNPITLFRASPSEARWYNNASFTIGGSGSRSEVDVPNDSVSLIRRLQDQTQTQVQGRQSLTMGNLSISSTASLNRSLLEALAPVDPEGAGLPERNEDRGEWSSNISYRQPLIGSTSISPFLQIGQSIRRDTLTAGEYLTGPTRLSFGTSVNPDLFGFFPGIGSYSAIRHHLQPIITYSYSPEVQLDSLQRQVFGTVTGQAQNVIQLSLNQTFEAKLREPSRVRPADTLSTVMDDTTGVGAERQISAAPPEPQKVQILSINTSTVGYDFVKASKGESGFIGETLRNSIRSDFFRGLNIDFSHDLFDESGIDQNDPEQRGRLGAFAPHLSQVNASFSFGQGSALIRRLFGLRDREPESVTPTSGVIPGAQPEPDTNPPGSLPFTRNPQAVGGGPWNASLSYSLIRPREVTDTAGVRLLGLEESQNVNGTISFSPTPNWAVNWNTSYSITEGKFGEHRLNLRRNLYRWQADFDFSRTIYGNTAFSVSVRLTDLPDLKLDYRERDLGGTTRTARQ